MNGEYLRQIDEEIVEELDEFLEADMENLTNQEIQRKINAGIIKRRVVFLYQDKNRDVHYMIYPPVFVD